MDPCLWLRNWLCQDLRGNSVIFATVVAGILSLVLFVIGVQPYIPVLIGSFFVAFAGYQVWSLRSLAAEIDRFSKENARLEETEEQLQEEIDKLESTKRNLSQHCSQLESTVTELTNVSEGLQNELDGFTKLKSNLEQFAKETGADIRSILGKAEELHSKMARMTAENERSLLGKIAQDLEFMDKDVGMSKYEFEKFMERLPQHCKDRFKEKGMTFDSVAGSDGIIDFMEVERMLEVLIRENRDKSSK